MLTYECFPSLLYRTGLKIFSLALLIFVLMSMSALAQQKRKGGALEKILQSDGTIDLDSGVRGSVNTTGFSMTLQEDGTPVFLSTQSGELDNENWQAGFGYPGANNEVKSVVIDGSGNLYIGGLFTTVAGLSANRVAMWNGNKWSALGTGMNDEVLSLTLDGSVLYAGGKFTTAGGTSANGVARWNGSEWSALGSGITKTSNVAWVFSLSVDSSGNLYAGGWFDTAGGAPANYIAMWDGNSWDTVGTSPNDGVDNTIYALYWDGTKLYVGGNFTHAGTIAVGYVAAWNGSSWEALGSGASPGVGYPGGVSSFVKDSSGILYVGGGFTQAGAVNAYVPANYIAKFSANAWSAVGSGTNGPVTALHVDDSNYVYAGGGFSSPEGLVAVWNGATWSGLGTGASGVNSLVLDGLGNIYAGGGFDSAGGNPAAKIAKWNGSFWAAMATGGMGPYTSHVVKALALDGSGNLYVGGDFTTAGKVNANRVAKWNGVSWAPLGTGIGDGQVHALDVDTSGNVYAGGSFSIAGGIPASYIAKWNGASWSTVGTLYSIVNALIVDDADNLYVGTTLNFSGSIFKWNGSNAFSGMGPLSGDVLALALDSSGNLYAGGNFTSGIAEWDGGISWTVLGGGMADGQVNALVFDSGDNLYAGGTFTTGGGSPASYIAKWDGSSWAAVGNGLNGLVRSLAVDMEDNLYAGGSFTTAGGNVANHIATWNGSKWSALGSGMNDDVYSLSVLKDSGELYAGGMFSTAGALESRYIAKAQGLPTGQSKFPWYLFLPALIHGPVP